MAEAGLDIIKDLLVGLGVPAAEAVVIVLCQLKLAAMESLGKATPVELLVVMMVLITMVPEVAV